MTKYFKNAQTLEELRKQYRDLLKKYHPDNKNGSTEATQDINKEYEELFKILKNRHESKTDEQKEKTSYNKKYDFNEDKQLREMLEKIIHFSNITIEIIGVFLWIGGSTYQYRKELKELGFKWSNNKKLWYWTFESYRKKSKKILSIDDIRSYYGSTEVETDTRKRLEA